MKNESGKPSGILKSLSRLPSIAAIRVFKRLLKRASPLEFDPDISSVIEFPELPGLLSLVRIFITIGILIRFLVHLPDYYNDGFRIELQIAIFVAFLINTLAFELSPQFRKKVTTTPNWRRVQLGVDILLISASYFLTYTIDSDFFLFYILPILFGAQYLTFRETFLLTIFVDGVFFLTLSILTYLKLNINPYFGSWLNVLARVYLLRAFSLTVIGIVSAFYRQIEHEKSKIKASIISILQRLSTLLRVVEYNDSLLVDRLIHMILAGITAQDGLGFERAMLFFKNEVTGQFEGKYGVGPLGRIIGKEMWRRSIPWNFDDIVNLNQRELHYKSRKLNQELASVIIPSNVVQFIEEADFEKSPFIKTTIQDHPLLSDVLGKFDLDWFIITPLYSLNKFMGFLISDNVVTDKYISPYILDDLVLFTNLIADVEENVALLREHILDEKGEAIVESSTSIAHEIRTPLTAIRIDAKLLMRKTEGEEVKNDLAKIIYDVDRIENIISKTHKFRSAYKGKSLSNESLAAIVTQILEEDQMSGQVESGNIELVNEVTDSAHDMQVCVDVDLIKSALRNIIQNAIDAVMDVKAKERKIKISIGQASTNSVQIVIQDSGPGIAEKDFSPIEKIFEPYGTSKTLTDHSGVGLGLSIAWAAIRAHGGSIRVKQSSQGARFVVTIPRWADLTSELKEGEE